MVFFTLIWPERFYLGVVCVVGFYLVAHRVLLLWVFVLRRFTFVWFVGFCVAGFYLDVTRRVLCCGILP